MKKIFVTFFILIFFISIGLSTFFTSGSTLSLEKEGNLFVVQIGDTYSHIVEKLKNEGYISSEILFKVMFALKASSQTIEPGGYLLVDNGSFNNLITSLTSPSYVWVHIPENLSRREIAEEISEALSWDQAKKAQFVTAYTAIQWDAFNEELIELFGKKFEWADSEKEAFATMGAFFSDREYDFMEHYYIPKDYLIPRDISRAQLANILVTEFETEYKDNIEATLQSKINEEKALQVKDLVRGEVELLPDLVPLAPYDVFLEKRDGKDILVFTTTYWNEGRGVFELRADEKTQGIQGDIERDVFQRVYRVDGGYRSKLVGTFLWHEIHLHYHFSDFIDYFLKRVDDGGGYIDTKKKATYCIRDVDPISLGSENAQESPTYRICGKERQGISIGWGDSYYYTYADQNIDVSNLPSGTYSLSFAVNPQRLFEESSYENNTVELLMKIDVANNILEIIN